MGSIPAGPLYREAGRPRGAEAHRGKARFYMSVKLGVRADSSNKVGSMRHKHQTHSHPRISRAGKGGPCRKPGLEEDLAGITSDIGEAEALGLAGAGGVRVEENPDVVTGRDEGRWDG